MYVPKQGVDINVLADMNFLSDVLDVAVGVGAGLAIGAALSGGGYAVNPVAHMPRPQAVSVDQAFANGSRIRGTVPYQVARPYSQGRVKALFIGINYTGTNSQLSGCVNDVRTMLGTLQRIEFPIQECCILVDDQRFPGFTALPTRQNIINYIGWLVNDARPGDVLFFHFSGHGTQTRSLHPETEDDGMDECMCPLDYSSAGVIVDDDIYELMVKRLPQGVRLTCLFDCCHSGTIMDLPFEFVGSNSISYNASLSMKRTLNNNFGPSDVIMFSGCADSQTSSDVSNTQSFGTGSAGAGGAATQALTWALTNTRGLSFAQMLIQMRDVLRQKKYQQVPQMSSTKPVDLHKPFSMFGALDVNTQQMHYVPQAMWGGFAPTPGMHMSPQTPYAAQFGQQPPQQPGYPPAQYPPPQQPGYPPQQPGYPPAQYPPPQQPGYPPTQYASQQSYPYPPQQPTYPPQGAYYAPGQPAYPAQPQYPPGQY